MENESTQNGSYSCRLNSKWLLIGQKIQWLEKGSNDWRKDPMNEDMDPMNGSMDLMNGDMDLMILLWIQWL